MVERSLFNLTSITCTELCSFLVRSLLQNLQDLAYFVSVNFVKILAKTHKW